MGAVTELIGLLAQAPESLQLFPGPQENTDLPGNVRVAAVVVTILLLGLVLELVRRRRLVERYALLWMGASIAMVVMAVWQGGLDALGNLIGVADPVNGIFLIAFGVVFLLMLNFSVAISRLSEETKILAQVVSRLDAELRELRAPGSVAKRRPDEAPVTAEEGSEDS